MLVEEGRIALSDPVSKFIPELKDMKVAVARANAPDELELVPAGREITLRDLLTHTSGLTYGFWGRPYFSALYGASGVSDGLIETQGTMGDNVRRLAKLPLMFQPGAE